jgi:hypothetical protein
MSFRFFAEAHYDNMLIYFTGSVTIVTIPLALHSVPTLRRLLSRFTAYRKFPQLRLMELHRPTGGLELSANYSEKKI